MIVPGYSTLIPGSEMRLTKRGVGLETTSVKPPVHLVAPHGGPPSGSYYVPSGSLSL